VAEPSGCSAGTRPRRRRRTSRARSAGEFGPTGLADRSQVGCPIRGVGGLRQLGAQCPACRKSTGQIAEHSRTSPIVAQHARRLWRIRSDAGEGEGERSVEQKANGPCPTSEAATVQATGKAGRPGRAFRNAWRNRLLFAGVADFAPDGGISDGLHVMKRTGDRGGTQQATRREAIRRDRWAQSRAFDQPLNNKGHGDGRGQDHKRGGTRMGRQPGRRRIPSQSWLRHNSNRGICMSTSGSLAGSARGDIKNHIRPWSS